MEAELIDVIAYRIVDLKKREAELAAERKEREDELAKLIATKEEGSETQKTKRFKITVTSKLKRTLDYHAYQAVEERIPDNFRCVKLKPDLDLKALRLMDAANPGFSAHFITTEPTRATVKVEEMQWK